MSDQRQNLASPVTTATEADGTAGDVSTIDEVADFPGVSAAELFEIYTDGKRHAAAIGGDVSLRPEPGSRFSAFGGNLSGTIYALVPGKMVAQSWRAATWKEHDLDSVLTLIFSDTPRGGRIHLVQANVPTHTYEIIKDGWERRYWRPWREHLRNERSAKPQ